MAAKLSVETRHHRERHIRAVLLVRRVPTIPRPVAPVVGRHALLPIATGPFPCPAVRLGPGAHVRVLVRAVLAVPLAVALPMVGDAHAAGTLKVGGRAALVAATLQLVTSVLAVDLAVAAPLQGDASDLVALVLLLRARHGLAVFLVAPVAAVLLAVAGPPREYAPSIPASNVIGRASVATQGGGGLRRTCVEKKEGRTKKMNFLIHFLRNCTRLTEGAVENAVQSKGGAAV